MSTNPTDKSEPDDVAVHVNAVLQNLEAMDEAGENFAAEVLKYDAESFPVGAIRELQKWADEQNAYRRQMIREVRKLIAVAFRNAENRRATERLTEIAEQAAKALQSRKDDPPRKGLWWILFGD